MPVSGLVITFGVAEPEREAAISAIASHPAFTVGQPNGIWLPVAMEARDDKESRKLHDWLLTLHGITYVDVVAVNFSDISQGYSPQENIVSKSE